MIKKKVQAKSRPVGLKSVKPAFKKAPVSKIAGRKIRPAAKRRTSSRPQAVNPQAYNGAYNKAYDEAYDKGFNDGYTKGLEDGALND